MERIPLLQGQDGADNEVVDDQETVTNVNWEEVMYGECPECKQDQRCHCGRCLVCSHATGIACPDCYD